jgi:hypothetical protein
VFSCSPGNEAFFPNILIEATNTSARPRTFSAADQRSVFTARGARGGVYGLRFFGWSRDRLHTVPGLTHINPGETLYLSLAVGDHTALALANLLAAPQGLAGGDELTLELPAALFDQEAVGNVQLPATMPARPHTEAGALDGESRVFRSEQELLAYQKYRKELLESAPDPRFIRTDAELNRLQQALDRPPPAEYAAVWRDTKAVRQREQWRQDAEVLRKEVNKAAGEFRDLVAQWNKIQSDPLTASQRRSRERELLNKADNLPYREENKDRLLPGSSTLTYDNVLQFERVADAYRAWRAIRPEQKQ